MTLALALAFVATRRWSGAILTVVAVPAASGLTEYVLKPRVGGLLGHPSFPSGHATIMFALAAIVAILLAGPFRHRVPGALRLLLVLMALVLATAVAAAMVAIQAHSLTDIVAGAPRWEPGSSWPAPSSWTWWPATARRGPERPEPAA